MFLQSKGTPLLSPISDALLREELKDLNNKHSVARFMHEAKLIYKVNKKQEKESGKRRGLERTEELLKKCAERVRMCGFCVTETMEGGYNDGVLMEVYREGSEEAEEERDYE